MPILDITERIMKLEKISQESAGRNIRDHLVDYVITVATIPDEKDNKIILQDFFRDGERFFAIFSSWQEFDSQTKGSPFEKEGIEIDRKFFASILKGDEVIILNPDGEMPIRLSKSDLEQ